MAINIDWNPVVHVGPVPINWYGLTFALGLGAGWMLVRRWAPAYAVARDHVDALFAWIVVGTIFGARLYFILQHEPLAYIREPWRLAAVWEGGLAFFGGLLGATLAAWVYTQKHGLPFARLADLFAPAIPIGAAIGRSTCGLAGMDYGTPTDLPWGVRYLNTESFAPVDGIVRHPVPFYELAGDLMIAVILFRLRGRLPEGWLFLSYLILFSTMRFFLFFLRGDVPYIAFELTNGHLTALAILVAAMLAAFRLRIRPPGSIPTHPDRGNQ